MGLCIGECTPPVKRKYLRATVAIKRKLVQGYQKDLELIRRTHPGPKHTQFWDRDDQDYCIMIKKEQERQVLYSFDYDKGDQFSRPAIFPVIDLKSILNDSLKNAQDQLDFWEGIYREQMKDRWAFIMTAKGFCRSPEGYYGPTKLKRFIQAMAFTDQGILRHIVSFM